LPVSYLHVFTYSERPLTKAITLNESVGMFERRKRNNILRMLSEKKKNDFYKRMIGSELDVLLEANNRDGTMKGFSSNYVRLQTPFNVNLINEFTKIKVTSAADNLCTGEIVLPGLQKLRGVGIKKSIDSLAS